MPIVVGINFKKAGRVYYFDPGGLDLKENDLVIAETSRGIELGEVTIGPREVEESELVAPLKRVLRLAAPRDIDQEKAISEKEKEGFAICQQKIEKHGLEMKLIDVEYNFDGTQGTFFFSAEGRVDFRELVKDLAQALRIKVQLHQVGVRDEAKMFGGLGPCGRSLCCASFLTNFDPVSMKMAKEQSLFLNPAKFSGLCGKLMCCLRYEYEVYKEAKVRLPAMNSIVQTPRGQGRVIGMNVIKDTVMVDVHEHGVIQFQSTELGGRDGEPPAQEANDEVEAPVAAPMDASDRTPATAPLALGDGGCSGCGECGGCPANSMPAMPAAETPMVRTRPPKAHREPRANSPKPAEPHEAKESHEPREPREQREPREPKAQKPTEAKPRSGESGRGRRHHSSKPKVTEAKPVDSAQAEQAAANGNGGSTEKAHFRRRGRGRSRGKGPMPGGAANAGGSSNASETGGS